MAAKKRPRRAPKPIPAEGLETFTTRLPTGLLERIKIAAVHHKVSVQVLTRRGLEMVLGDL